MLITIPVLVALVYLVRSTRQGKAMRAMAQDNDAARMMGIDVDRTIAFTFLLGGALAGAGGLMFVHVADQHPLRPRASSSGCSPSPRRCWAASATSPAPGWARCLIGLVAGLQRGLSSSRAGSSWTQSVIFAILILVLVFRPQGLLGETEADRA